MVLWACGVCRPRHEAHDEQWQVHFQEDQYRPSHESSYYRCKYNMARTRSAGIFFFPVYVYCFGKGHFSLHMDTSISGHELSNRYYPGKSVKGFVLLFLIGGKTVWRAVQVGWSQITIHRLALLSG